jgi:hypothetical protein
LRVDPSLQPLIPLTASLARWFFFLCIRRAGGNPDDKSTTNCLNPLGLQLPAMLGKKGRGGPATQLRL